MNNELRLGCSLTAVRKFQQTVWYVLNNDASVVVKFWAVKEHNIVANVIVMAWISFVRGVGIWTMSGD